MYIYIYTYIHVTASPTPPTPLCGGGGQKCMYVCLDVCIDASIYFSPPVVGVCGGVVGAKCMYVCMYVCMCVCMCVCMYVCNVTSTWSPRTTHHCLKVGCTDRKTYQYDIATHEQLVRIRLDLQSYYPMLGSTLFVISRLVMNGHCLIQRLRAWEAVRHPFRSQHFND